MTHKICFKAATKDIAIVPVASDTPEGFTNIGDYIHDTGDDPLGAAVSHVLYHHIRDALYQVGVQDMAYIDITFTSEVGAPPISCIYPFDSLDAAVTGYGYAGAVSVVGQVGSLTTVGGLGAQSQRLSTSALAQTVDFSTDKKVVEVFFTSSHAVMPSGVNGAAIAMKLLDSATLAVIAGAVMTITPGGLTAVIVSGGSTARATVPFEGLQSVVGLEFDSVSGTYRAIVDGAGIDLTSNVFTPGACLLAFESSEGSGVAAGVTLTAEARTSVSDITQIYAVGATDLCGNALQLTFPDN